MPFENGVHPGGEKRKPHSAAGKRRAERELLESGKLEAEARDRILAKTRLKLTPELIDELEHGMAQGNYPEVLARRAGVNVHTYRQWVAAGEEAWLTGNWTSENDPLGLRVELYLRIDQADATWESTLVESMNESIRSGEYWAGKMAFLQRRHPERWDTTGRGGEAKKGWEDMLDEWRAERLRSSPAEPAESS